MHVRLDITKKTYKNLVGLPNNILITQLKNTLLPNNLPSTSTSDNTCVLFVKLSGEDVNFFMQKAAQYGLSLTSLLNFSANIEGKVNFNLEKFYQAELHRKLGGLMEVNVPCGRIDLLTNSHIWEVKFAKDYKAAIGQALCYSVYKTGYKPGIALIGKLSKRSKNIVEQCCKALKVELMWIPITHE